MFRVYWTEDCPISKDFEEISPALKFIEELRIIQSEYDTIRHIVLSCENPNSVGKHGVDTVSPDYNWSKRRIIGTGRKRRQ
jgi:hypothetical protein